MHLISYTKKKRNKSKLIEEETCVAVISFVVEWKAGIV